MEQQTTIPTGLCQCGCGQKTKLYTRTRPKWGNVAGQPVRYLRGHSRKGQYGRTVTREGYVYVIARGHPKAKKRGTYVFEHRLIAEKALGHYLPEGAVVHHVNGIVDDNRCSNLVVCENNAYHHLIERRTRAIHACGHADWYGCHFCKSWDDPKNMYVYKRSIYGQGSAKHRRCHAKYVREREAR